VLYIAKCEILNCNAYSVLHSKLITFILAKGKRNYSASSSKHATAILFSKLNLIAIPRFLKNGKVCPIIQCIGGHTSQYYFSTVIGNVNIFKKISVKKLLLSLILFKKYTIFGFVIILW